MQQKDKKAFFHDDLKRRILTLELMPGLDLDESTLSKEYQISRTPLRDVMRTLAGEGYLEIRSNRGARVAPMNHKTLHDFFLVAPMIYSSVSRLAARNCTRQQITQLKKIQREFMRAVSTKDIAKKVYYNDCFHGFVGDMADNVYLKPSLQRLMIDHTRIAQTFYNPTDRAGLKVLKTAAHHHDEMIAAYEKHDEKRSERLAIEHWDLSRKQMEKFIMPSSLDIKLDDQFLRQS